MAKSRAAIATKCTVACGDDENMEHYVSAWPVGGASEPQQPSPNASVLHQRPGALACPRRGDAQACRGYQRRRNDRIEVLAQQVHNVIGGAAPIEIRTEIDTTNKV